MRNVHIQGELTSTGNNLDLALTGNGWFQIEGADGETLYTRAGAFNTNATGQLVTVDGYTVIPAITVPGRRDRSRRQQDPARSSPASTARPTCSSSAS